MAKLKGKDKDRKRKLERRKQENRQRRFYATQIAKLRTFDDPLLRMKCHPVEGDSSSIVAEIKTILRLTPNGVGLAAPQIGHQLRVIAIRPNHLDQDNVYVMINPEILSHSKVLIKAKEACLSYPGVETEVERYDVIAVRYTDEEGVSRLETKEGYEARIVQHELDHLNGICQVGDAWRLSKNPPSVRNVGSKSFLGGTLSVKKKEE